MKDLHPSYKHILQFFTYKHLPLALQEVSKPFSDLAHKVARESTGPEGSVALRKLLEAKDAAVRARLEGNPLREKPKPLSQEEKDEQYRKAVANGMPPSGRFA